MAASLRYRHHHRNQQQKHTISDFSAGARATRSVDQVSMFTSEATGKIKTIKQTKIGALEYIHSDMYCT